MAGALRAASPPSRGVRAAVAGKKFGIAEALKLYFRALLVSSLHVARSTAVRPSVPAPPASPSPTGPQLYRLQYLLEWLRSGRPLTAGRAAHELEVSERTVASDIAYLRHVGVPLAFDRRRNTYVLTEPFGNLPLVALSRTDLAAFLVARHALDALGDTAHAPLLADVAERLARHLPEAVRVAPETLTRTIRFDPGPRPHTRFPWLVDAGGGRARRARGLAPVRLQLAERRGRARDGAGRGAVLPPLLREPVVPRRPLPPPPGHARLPPRPDPGAGGDPRRLRRAGGLRRGGVPRPGLRHAPGGADVRGVRAVHASTRRGGSGRSGGTRAR